MGELIRINSLFLIHSIDKRRIYHLTVHSEINFFLFCYIFSFQICQGREVTDGGAAGDTGTPRSVVVVKV